MRERESQRERDRESEREKKEKNKIDNKGDKEKVIEEGKYCISNIIRLILYVKDKQPKSSYTYDKDVLNVCTYRNNLTETRN